MIKQTIALFRYQLLGLFNTKLGLLLGALFLVAFLGNRFIFELAIINSETIALAAMADFLRYSLILMLIIGLSYQVSQDYVLSQFDRLLAMPIVRMQYVVAQFLLVAFFSFALTLPMFILISLMGNPALALYWALAVFLEMILVGQLTILAILSLEKLPVAVFFSLAIYLLAKSAPLINLILSQSSHFYEVEAAFHFSNLIFSIIRYVLPVASSFAQNNVIFEASWSGFMLLKQLLSVLIYGVFIQLVILFDFYRKEFN